MDLQIRNRTAMVAAASRGIGKGVALTLAREGCRVSICGRTLDSLREAKADIEAQVPGAVVLPVVADVTRADDLAHWVLETERTLGPVDILVANGGGPPAGTFLSLEDPQWQGAVESTLLSVVRLVRAVVPAMRERRWGRIVTITSLTAKQPEPIYTLSATLRTGLSGLTKVLSREFARDGITVNAVLPGQILTEGQEQSAARRMAVEGLSREAHFQRLAESIPVGFIGTPEDLGAAVAFLCGEPARYITGVSLQVDGGAIHGTF